MDNKEVSDDKEAVEDMNDDVNDDEDLVWYFGKMRLLYEPKNRLALHANLQMV